MVFVANPSLITITSLSPHCSDITKCWLSQAVHQQTSEEERSQYHYKYIVTIVLELTSIISLEDFECVSIS